MNDRGCFRALVPEHVYVSHNVVSGQPLFFRDSVEIDVVYAILHFSDLLGRDSQTELLK